MPSTLEKTDKRARATLFRDRLGTALRISNLSQSALARRIGVDRSTISQLLTSDSARLPGAQIVAECAAALGVSADWLLGLSDRPEQGDALIEAAMTMTKAPRALVDEQIFAWHQEAAGYKIRYVPATLPDMLKTPAMLRWEYGPSLGPATEQAIAASEERLNWMRSAGSDYEIALPLHALHAFASAEGYYRGLPATVRREQIARLQELHDQFYPALRVYLFDARHLYSAPVTIFGPLFAVLYLGQNYLAFRDRARVETLTSHFDSLVRAASVTSRELPALLDRLAERLN